MRLASRPGGEKKSRQDRASTSTVPVVQPTKRRSTTVRVRKDGIAAAAGTATRDHVQHAVTAQTFTLKEPGGVKENWDAVLPALPVGVAQPVPGVQPWATPELCSHAIACGSDSEVETAAVPPIKATPHSVAGSLDTLSVPPQRTAAARRTRMLERRATRPLPEAPQRAAKHPMQQADWSSAFLVLSVLLAAGMVAPALLRAVQRAGTALSPASFPASLTPAASFAVSAGASAGRHWGGWWPGSRHSPAPLATATPRVRSVATSAASTVAPTASQHWLPSAAVRVVSIVPGGASSPYKNAAWDEVMRHIAKRLDFTDPSFEMRVYTEQELSDPSPAGTAAWDEALVAMGQGSNILLAAGVTNPVLISRIEQAGAAQQLPSVRVFLPVPGHETPARLTGLTSLQGYAAQAPDLVDQAVSGLLPWSWSAKNKELWSTVQELWNRHSSDDLLFVYLVLINQYVTPVKEVAMTTKGSDLESIRCMLTHCRSEIFNCINTPMCKAGLDCLQACSFNDQICQYRCIVSYETPQFSEFTLCIIQKHNCRRLNAQPPTRPDPGPMTIFRGTPLTFQTAEDMLLGWMARGPGEEPGPGSQEFSWLVAAGKNPAYDWFPCQHQLFYRGKGQGVIWYEPIFKVITLDGRQVWRRRRYRVKRGPSPGTFYFSVLDNGATSNEYWRILDCDDGLSWCLFYYSGAASSAGMSYSGAVLGTPDGSYPTDPEAVTRIEAALRRAGIEPWELSFVDNTKCSGAPFELVGTPA